MDVPKGADVLITDITIPFGAVRKLVAMDALSACSVHSLLRYFVEFGKLAGFAPTACDEEVEDEDEQSDEACE